MNRQRWFGRSSFSMVFQVTFLHWKCQLFCHHPHNGHVVKSGGLFGMLPIHDPTCTWTDKSFSGSNPPNTRIIKEIIRVQLGGNTPQKRQNWPNFVNIVSKIKGETGTSKNWILLEVRQAPTNEYMYKTWGNQNSVNSGSNLYLLNRMDFRTILTVFCLEEIVSVYRRKQGRSLKKSPWNSQLFRK